MAVDLNALRKVVIENQDEGNGNPSEPNKQVVVDKEGNVLVGGQRQDGEPTTLVPQETFANWET